MTSQIMRCSSISLLLAGLLLVSSEPKQPKYKTLLTNPEQPEECRDDGDDDDSNDSFEGPDFSVRQKQNSLERSCGKDILNRFRVNEPEADLRNAKRGNLDCNSLQLSPSMQSLEFAFDGKDYEAKKTHFEQYRQHGNRYVWTGEITQNAGFMHVVWTDDCDPKIFRLNVNLHTPEADTRRNIKTVPCSNGDPKCMWTADLVTKGVVEDYVSPNSKRGRKLQAEVDLAMAENPELQALDDDIALLAALDAGDSDAHDQFHRYGGRRLEAEGQVLMPSGRRLDDGKTVRILYLYGQTVRQQIGDEGIISQLTAAITSHNMVLANSLVNFRMELASIQFVDTDGTMNDLWNAMNSASMPRYSELREKYQADLVQFYTMNDSGFCGYGSVLPSASSAYAPYGNSIVRPPCISNFSNIHEAGHNFGLLHNTEDSPSGTAWPYGYGMRYCQEGAKKPPFYGTIMAYPCSGGGRVPYYSSPKVMYNGKQTGWSMKDNVRVLANTRFTVANFRQGTGSADASTADPQPASNMTEKYDKPKVTVKHTKHGADVSSGQSLPLRLDVTQDGEYEVAYDFIGSVAPFSYVKAYLVKGNKCDNRSAGGEVAKTLQPSDEFVKHHATVVHLEQGKDQAYSLCFEKARKVVVGSICIAVDCP